MRTTLFSTAALALSLLISCGEPTPAEPTETTNPVANQEVSVNSTGPGMTTKPLIKNAGLMSYNGAYAILTDCEGDKVYLGGELIETLLDDIKRFKADPNYTLWLVIGTVDYGQPATDGTTTRVHETGVVLSREPKGPCDTAQDK